MTALRTLHSQFLSMASTVGAALGEADIRKAIETVRYLSDDLKARSRPES